MVVNSLDAAREKQITQYLNNLSVPAAVLNSDLVCVCSNRKKLLPKRTRAAKLLQKPYELPFVGEHINMALIDGVMYCARIFPIEDGLYFCEFLDRGRLLDLSENTDLFSKISSVVCGFEFNSAALWRSFDIIGSKLGDDDKLGEFCDCMHSCTKYLNAMSSLAKNANEYLKLLFYKNKGFEPLNIALLLADTIDRCNQIIAPTNRLIEFYYDGAEIFVNSPARHALTALMNMLQNALIYSPRDCDPIVTISADDGSVMIRVVNKPIIDIDGVSSYKSVDYSGVHAGCGFPILKRFAEIANGEFSFGRLNNGMPEAKLVLPTIDSSVIQRKKIVLRNSRYIRYDTGIPDIVDIMMNEVVELFPAADE